MKAGRIIQFIAAAILFSIACICVLVHVPAAGFFILTMTVKVKLEDSSRKQLLFFWGCIAIAFAIGLAGIVSHVLAAAHHKALAIEPTGLRFLHQPAFVIPFWLLMIFLLFMAWRSERKLVRDQQVIL